MSVLTSDFSEGEPIVECDYCGKGLNKWIEIVPGGNLCENCAQMTMRRLFEDLIEFHNPGKQHISLLKIMHHGKQKEIGQIPHFEF